jgi:hypothetical protein
LLPHALFIEIDHQLMVIYSSCLFPATSEHRVTVQQPVALSKNASAWTGIRNKIVIVLNGER